MFAIKLLRKYLKPFVLYVFVSSSILEVEEENYSEKSETSSKISANTLTVRHHVENTLHFKYDLSTINQFKERRDSEFTYRLDLEQRAAEDDSLLAFCPIEVHERKFLRNLQQQKEQQEACSSSSMFAKKEETTKVSNSLQIPVISVPNVMEKPPPTENVYTSENMTIIDTDLPVNKRIVAESKDFLIDIFSFPFA